MEKHDAVLDGRGRCQMTETTDDRYIVCGAPADHSNHIRYPVIGSGARPLDEVHTEAEIRAVTTRFTDEAETHGTEPEDMVEATPSDQDEEVGMFPDGTVVGDQSLPGVDLSSMAMAATPWRGVVRRTDMPKEYVLVSSAGGVAGPMTEAEAMGLRFKLERLVPKLSTTYEVRRMIPPSDL